MGQTEQDGNPRERAQSTKMYNRGMTVSPQPLKGKVALITGGAKRLGRASALALAEAGADVAITFEHSQREARQTVVDLGSFGVRAVALRCDVTDEKSVHNAVKETVKELGGIDVLVNNAANYETVEFAKLTLKQWDVARSSETSAGTQRENRQYGIARRGASLGDACPLLLVEGCGAHADPGNGQGVGS
jgi:hypothetical protein